MMKVYYPDKFKENLKHFSKEVQKKFYKQVGFLLKNIRHPSLHAKKYNESLDIWQARVDKSIRFYFTIEGDNYNLLYIKHHPK